MWQDYCGRALLKTMGVIVNVVVVHTSEHEVLHMRDQIQQGLDVVGRFMEKRAYMVVGERSQGVAALQRRMLADASTKFNAPLDISKMHHVGYIDFSKFGRLTTIDINQAAEWAKSILTLNDEYSHSTICIYCKIGMILAVAPLLASEGVLGGIRGEMRRIEDKFIDNMMECKSINIPFDLSSAHGNRSLPASLPGWMIVLDTTLGAKQGTLYKVPRSSDRPAADTNTFAKNDWWSLHRCGATLPVNPGDYVTPESGTLFTHEQGRSLTDKEETSQWVSGLATLKEMMTACVSRVSSLKHQTCLFHHFSCYEGNFEKVMLDLMVELNDRVYIGFHSSAPNQTVFEFAAASVKDKLLEAGINMLSATNWINFWARIEHAFAPERIGSKVPIWSGQCHQSIVQRQKWEIFKCRSCRT
ncbi:unnamed protein product [Durusdinium trenchii]|uniref:Uncharacterized protein n=1 Tax=Durusdinium trenchii TaxID=1381693 RepID=A0ABP0I050_9DINO